jgi:hypothetical protein
VPHGSAHDVAGGPRAPNRRCPRRVRCSPDSRYAAVISRLGSELEGQRDERKRLQSQIDDLVSADAADTAEIDRKIGGGGVMTEARKAMRTVADGNQIYRLAAGRSGSRWQARSGRSTATARNPPWWSRKK